MRRPTRGNERLRESGEGTWSTLAMQAKPLKSTLVKIVGLMS
jgi:hypothetical protein